MNKNLMTLLLLCSLLIPMGMTGCLDEEDYEPVQETTEATQSQTETQPQETEPTQEETAPE